MSYSGDLTPTEAWELLTANPDAVLVDVRTRAEWAYVGVPDLAPLGRRAILDEWVTYPQGAANPTFLQELESAGLQAGDNRPIVFLCRSGHRSIAAARAATAAGLGPAYNVLDGFEGTLDAEGHRGGTGWRAADLPWLQR